MVMRKCPEGASLRGNEQESEGLWKDGKYMRGNTVSGVDLVEVICRSGACVDFVYRLFILLRF
jgi:hypothetical protein